MATKAVIYSLSGKMFLKLIGNKPKRVYSLKFLERISGLKLKDNAPESLAKFGYIRVCSDCDSYLKMQGGLICEY